MPSASTRPASSSTSTPIPRTLHMSLSGLRDISVIETPPEGRRPIRTTVADYDEELVKLALEREHERGGQSFYLHNRVETIEEAAQKLQQLYQIRGRVGRSDVTAHAYLFYPDMSELTPEARARLATLADHTELGAGFAIAMRDLEIRGAGNLLGDEQSGHIAALGFELYVEMLAEAVAELSGERRIAARPVRVDAR